MSNDTTPWRLQYDEHGATRRGWHLEESGGRTLWLDAGEFTEAEALAVRDALNRPSAPDGLRAVVEPFLRRDIIKYGALSRGVWRDYEKHIEALNAALGSAPRGTREEP
jgi:hypothetical protein